MADRVVEERKRDFRTLHGRADQVDTESWGGRYNEPGKPLRPEDGYPRAWSPWEADAGNVEPPSDVGVDCGNTFDGTLTRGHPDVDTMALNSGQSAPVPSPIDGASPAEVAPLSAVETPQLVSPPSLTLSPVAGDVGQSGIGVKAGPLTPEQDQAMRQFIRRRPL